MCGLTGFWNPVDDKPIAELLRIAAEMANLLPHRGPDDLGHWADAALGLALGHRRLPIVDLTPSGHQPMVSSSGRFVVAFNGEIYNHQDLREQLSADGGVFAWRGHSDTETLLAGFEKWGVEATLERSVGMFAFALWDTHTKTLTLARDRLGEKPLYYGWSGGAFLFGSELKALRAYPAFDGVVCRDALTQYLRFTYVPAPRSIYQGIYKLEPGCILTVEGSPPKKAPSNPLRPGDTHGSMRMHRWWSLKYVVEKGIDGVSSETELITKLESTLTRAVSLQSLADVPLGAFLSGGVDSSTIVALMQQQAKEQGSDPVKTFTIGFDEGGFDESPYARAVAEHLGTEHHEMRVTARMAQDLIPTLPWMYDEPFADSSQIPTHLVCKAARQHVTVALSGDAGDELFGGYNRYFWGPRIWNRLRHVPLVARQSLAKLLVNIPIPLWDRIGETFSKSQLGVVRLGEKLHKLSEAIDGAKELNGLYVNLLSTWSDPASLVISDSHRKASSSPQHSSILLGDPLPHTGVAQSPLPMMYQDTVTYLPDDILCKVDRAAMACSLETRVPFLDHRVVELAWQLPLHMKVRGNVGKWALRQVLYKHVPKELIERPKAGFAIPVGQWLREPLRDWAENLLDEGRLLSEGYLKPAPIRQVWQEHLSGRRDHTSRLWTILMFQAWLEHNP
jgi:asparagine synthase (glutamine-hydrolysing)